MNSVSVSLFTSQIKNRSSLWYGMYTACMWYSINNFYVLQKLQFSPEKLKCVLTTCSTRMQSLIKLFTSCLRRKAIH
ncbi:hypothetical protein GDO81_003242 [Engystomops pustulosus]|uniref:Uncharacterized protein n=1 Tax=Engystomops pustulosus TaxID=76066 RepID=A0AAV6ZUQ1_ENGPU|nr:hypothetical protein GDO81_003242 [Engystomops pustulosus]